MKHKDLITAIDLYHHQYDETSKLRKALSEHEATLSDLKQIIRLKLDDFPEKAMIFEGRKYVEYNGHLAISKSNEIIITRGDL